MKALLSSFLGNKNLANIFSKDWLLKFVSLVMAVVLWSFVGGEDRVDKNVMIPIEIINLPRDLVISNQFKKEIEVTVSGPRTMILELSSRAVTRQVDLSAATPGTMVIENDNDHIPVPRGITVQRIQPSSIILSLDKLIQKQYPVTARTVGKVADGYFIKMLKTDPDVITIAGPQTTLSQFDELYTKAINLAGVKQSAQIQVPLELGPAIVELIGETSVTADLTVGLETVTRTMEGMKVHASIDGVLREVQPAEVKVTANIPLMLLARKVDPKSLFSVTALKKEGEERLVVKAIPKADVELPIEILSIIPGTVLLVDDNPSPVYQTSKGAEKKDQGATKIPKQKVREIASKQNAEEVKAGKESGEAPVKVLLNTKKKRILINQ
jgi:YbbR domain-containing protein